MTEPVTPDEPRTLPTPAEVRAYEQGLDDGRLVEQAAHRAATPALDVERLAEWFHNKWEAQGIACWHRNQYVTAWDCGRDAIEAAEYARLTQDRSHE